MKALLLVRTAGCSLDNHSHLSRDARTKIVKAVERARDLLPLRILLRIMRLSSSRFQAWKNAETSCHPAEGSHCPRRMPNQLTSREVCVIGDMVTSPDYRHVPTSRLALLAQRLGKVFASPSTRAKLVRQKGWQRPACESIRLSPRSAYARPVPTRPGTSTSRSFASLMGPRHTSTPLSTTSVDASWPSASPNASK